MEKDKGLKSSPKETIDLLNKIFEGCKTASMKEDQLLILSQVIDQVGGVETTEGVEWEIIEGHTREGQQRIADIFGPR